MDEQVEISELIGTENSCPTASPYVHAVYCINAPSGVATLAVVYPIIIAPSLFHRRLDLWQEVRQAIREVPSALLCYCCCFLLEINTKMEFGMACPALCRGPRSSGKVAGGVYPTKKLNLRLCQIARESARPRGKRCPANRASRSAYRQWVPCPLMYARIRRIRVNVESLLDKSTVQLSQRIRPANATTQTQTLRP